MVNKLNPSAVQMRLFLVSVIFALIGLTNHLIHSTDNWYIGDTEPVQVSVIESITGGGEPPTALDLTLTGLLFTALLLATTLPYSWAPVSSDHAYRLLFSNHARPRDPPTQA